LFNPLGDISFTEVRAPIFIARIGDSGTTLPPRGHYKSEKDITACDYPASDDNWREIGTGRTIRPLIERDLIAWLTTRGALTNERALALTKRVRTAHRCSPARCPRSPRSQPIIAGRRC
jgi:hypothetical protein